MINQEVLLYKNVAGPGFKVETDCAGMEFMYKGLQWNTIYMKYQGTFFE